MRDTIDMAREAGIDEWWDNGGEWRETFNEHLKAFETLVRADERAAPVQEPVAWVDLLKQAEEVVRSKSLWKKYINGTPLANDIAVWMVTFAQEYATPPAAQPTTEKSSEVQTAAQPALVQEPDHADELTIAYMSGLHRGKELAAPVQEPVAKYIGECSEGSLVQLYENVKKGTNFYTTPPAAPVRPTKDVEISNMGKPFTVKAYVTPLAQPAPVQEPASPAAHLMGEAHKYWKHANARHYGAVQWIENNETGELLIYTRGEYRKTLMANIPNTAPPAAQRQWVGLTDAEVMQTMSGNWTSQFYFARAIEAKLKERNNGLA